MIHTIWLTVWAALSTTLVAPAIALSTATAAPVDGSPLDGLKWMTGDWQLTEASKCTEEHWTSPSETDIIGMSRTIDKGIRRSFEFMRIEARPDGIFFVAQPGGRPPVDFKLTTVVGAELVFVNPGHADHLKRVIYRRLTDSTMLGRIEGEDDGKPFAVDYRYNRVADIGSAARCGGAVP